jgi:membrane protease YdiL (CAAX protease family)
MVTRYLAMAFVGWSAWCLGMWLAPGFFAEPYPRAAARILVLAVPTYLWTRCERRAGRVDPLLIRSDSRRGLAWGLGAAIAFLVPAAALRIADGASLNVPSHGAIWLNFIVGSPIAEEAFFRGFLYQSYRRVHGVWLAAVFSSLLFALFHLPAWWVGGDPILPLVRFATIFVYGLAFAGLFQISRSLHAPKIAHVLNNFVSLSLG